MSLPTIAFCITCKGRLNHLQTTLPKNISDAATYPFSKFVVVDYGCKEGTASYLNETYPELIESGRLTVYQFPTEEPFHMAHAKNLAHRCGIQEGADILVNLDADNYTGPEFAEYIVGQFHLRPHGVLNGRRTQPRGVNGRIVVSRSAFLTAGGYDEKYNTWSPDDEDFKTRLMRLGYTCRAIDMQYLDAIKHGDKLRFREYKHACNGGEDDLDEVYGSDATIANFGQFGMGTVYRNGSTAPLELGPVATRVFGIGMHKTATTSLDAAFKILGYDSAHWIHPDWAKAVWTQMTEQGRSLALERYYAVSDLPVTLLYEQLDRAYPGSKFILTVRDEVDWLRSVRDHWSYERNPHRMWWDMSPFTHRLHKRLYGQEAFDAEIFLARYRRHNNEVMAYFKNRPDDLLVMDMSARTNRWGALCTFLRQPVPSVPYPKEFATERSEVKQ